MSSRARPMGNMYGGIAPVRRRRRKGITHPSDIRRSTGPRHSSDAGRMDNFQRALDLNDPAIRYALLTRRRKSGDRMKGMG